MLNLTKAFGKSIHRREMWGGKNEQKRKFLRRVKTEKPTG